MDGLTHLAGAKVRRPPFDEDVGRPVRLDDGLDDAVLTEHQLDVRVFVDLETTEEAHGPFAKVVFAHVVVLVQDLQITVLNANMV